MMVWAAAWALRRKGQALVETALVAPILLLLILGVSELGSALTDYSAVTTASREGARLAARGNIFGQSDLLAVVEDHSGRLNLSSAGSVIVTTIHSNGTTLTVNAQRLLGTATSRFTATNLQGLYQEATASNPSLGSKPEELVMVEVFYNHPTMTGWFGSIVPMYAYSVMPVSAPS
jgi:Flp pilus assembly protein TadG